LLVGADSLSALREAPRLITGALDAWLRQG